MPSWPRHYFVAAAIIIAICAFALPSYADTEYVSGSGCSGCYGYAFQATLTSTGTNTYSLSYTITNVSGSAADAQSLSLTPFQSGNNITSFSNFKMSDGNTNAYQVLVGKSNNGANGNCNSSVGGAVCITTTGLGTLSKIGHSLTFSFNFTCSNCVELSSWDFLAHGTCDPGSGNCYAISNNGSNTPVPEPSTLALYITTLAAMGIVVGWRGRARVRSRSSGIATCCAR